MGSPRDVQMINENTDTKASEINQNTDDEIEKVLALLGLSESLQSADIRNLKVEKIGGYELAVKEKALYTFSSVGAKKIHRVLLYNGAESNGNGSISYDVDVLNITLDGTTYDFGGSSTKGTPGQGVMLYLCRDDNATAENDKITLCFLSETDLSAGNLQAVTFECKEEILFELSLGVTNTLYVPQCVYIVLIYEDL